MFMLSKNDASIAGKYVRIAVQEAIYYFFIELIFLKVCGTTGCCFTPWSVNSVDEGEGVYVTGSSDLGECSQYDVNDGSQNNEIGIYFKSLRLNLNFKRKKNFRDFDWDVISISRYNCISSGF